MQVSLNPPERVERDAGAPSPRALVSDVLRQLAPSAAPSPGPGDAAWVSAADQARYTTLLLGPDPHAADHFFEELGRLGVPHDALLRGLLLGAAGDISALWDRGECTFAELSVAAMRLQGALEHLNARAHHG